MCDLRSWLLLTGLVGGLLSGSAQARPGPSYWPSLMFAQVALRSPELDRAQQQLEGGDFEEAVKTLQAGLNQPDLSDEMLAELYRLLGLAQLYLGNEEGAREAYERLLQARPDFQLPKTTPPKVRRLYARILEDIRKRRVRPVVLTADTLSSVPGNAPVKVAARIQDLPLGARANFYYRRAGGQAYSSVAFVRQKGESFEATVPSYEVPTESRPYEVEYYLEVADAAQRRLAGQGDAFAPLTLRVQPKPSAPTPPVSVTRDAWYSNPWVLGIGGAVAVGAAVGVVLVATSRQTGTVTITIRAP